MFFLFKTSFYKLKFSTSGNVGMFVRLNEVHSGKKIILWGSCVVPKFINILYQCGLKCCTETPGNKPHRSVAKRFETFVLNQPLCLGLLVIIWKQSSNPLQ